LISVVWRAGIIADIAEKMDAVYLKILAITLVVSGLIVSIGKAIDGLLLARHVHYLDNISMRAWNFLDDIKLRDIPGRDLKYSCASRILP